MNQFLSYTIYKREKKKSKKNLNHRLISLSFSWSIIMVHLTKLAAAAVNRTSTNAPYSIVAVKKLFKTSNYVRKESRDIFFTPSWAVGAKRRSDGSILLKTSVSGTCCLVFLFFFFYSKLKRKF